MKRAIKARIYPNAEQKAYINRLLGCSRFIYNALLAEEIKALKSNTKISFKELAKKVTTEIKPQNQFLYEAHSKVLQQKSNDLMDAFRNFWRERKKKISKHLPIEHRKGCDKMGLLGEKGFPQFKSKRDNTQSARFPVDAIIGIRGNRIDLIKVLKDIHFKCSGRDERYLNRHRDLIKSVTLTRHASGKYTISILVEYTPEPIKPAGDKKIGIDVGLKDFYTDSDGNKMPNLKFLKNELRRLKHYQRLMDKKERVGTGKTYFSDRWNREVEIKRNSNNREKARIKYARACEKVANKRENYLRQLSVKLVGENQTIGVETLNVKGMMKNHKLAQAISDVGWSRFISILQYKCEQQGKNLIKIDQFFPSSKRCNCCGYINKKLELSDREWVCPNCGAVLDRDYNAAKNILEESLRIENEMKGVGLSSPDVMPVESPPVGEAVVLPPISCGAKKQEQNDFYDFL